MDFDSRDLELRHGVGGEAVSGAGSDLLIARISGRSRNALTVRLGAAKDLQEFTNT